MRKWLLSSFEADLDARVARAFETKDFGPLPLDLEFVRLIPVLSDLYVHGFYHAAVALAGLIAERLCCDIIEIENFQVRGKTLSSDEKQAMMKLQFRNLINLLAKWALIQKSTKKSLHEIRDIRNRYVHPRQSPPVNPKEDAKRIINVLFDVARDEFGPSATGRYTIENGKLTARRGS